MKLVNSQQSGYNYVRMLRNDAEFLVPSKNIKCNQQVLQLAFSFRCKIIADH